MTVRIASLLLLVGACGSRAPATPPPPANLHGAWIDAVAARSPARIAALISLPARVLYDDALSSGRSPDCQPWFGGVREVVTAEQRASLATCIATTVTHSRFVDPIHRTGTMTVADLAGLVEPPIAAVFASLGADHRVVHGHSIGASEYDFTLSISPSTGLADLVALTVLRGDEPAGFPDGDGVGFESAK